MYTSQNLLRILLWETQRSHKRTDSEERLYKLETGILKFCIGIELFQHAWESEELDVLCQNLFEHVKNTLGETNFVSQIEILESEIDKAIICLENNKIRSKKLRLLRLYLERLRDGDFTSPAVYKPKQLVEECQ